MNGDRGPVARTAIHQTAAKQVHQQRTASVRENALRRAAAARRCVPVEGRYGPTLAARDPLLAWSSVPRWPGTFGLSGPERAREAARLLEAGWASWEIACVLVDPVVAA